MAQEFLELFFALQSDPSAEQVPYLSPVCPIVDLLPFRELHPYCRGKFFDLPSVCTASLIPCFQHKQYFRSSLNILILRDQQIFPVQTPTQDHASVQFSSLSMIFTLDVFLQCALIHVAYEKQRFCPLASILKTFWEGFL